MRWNNEDALPLLRAMRALCHSRRRSHMKELDRSVRSGASPRQEVIVAVDRASYLIERIEAYEVHLRRKDREERLLSHFAKAPLLDTLAKVSAGLHSVAEECSDTYKDLMKHRAMEFDNARGAVEDLIRTLQRIRLSGIVDIEEAPHDLARGALRRIGAEP